MQFYVGLHQPSDARHFAHCMISINRVRSRKRDFLVNRWMLDSGAFTELQTYGQYRHSVDAYASQIVRWSRCGQLVAAAAQDYMCEPSILERTGLDIRTHQRLTIERYDALRVLVPAHIALLPVLQGYLPQHYQEHLTAYGQRLAPGALVGVGSICKRNGHPRDIAAVLRAITQVRPDLRLHGFGVKQTALQSTIVVIRWRGPSGHAERGGMPMTGMKQCTWSKPSSLAVTQGWSHCRYLQRHLRAARCHSERRPRWIRSRRITYHPVGVLKREIWLLIISPDA